MGNSGKNVKDFFVSGSDLKKYIKPAIIVVSVVVLCFILISAALSTRDVYLGDFESGKHEFETDAFLSDAASFSLVENKGRDDSKCLKITNNEENDARYVKELYLQARRTYVVTGYIKTEGISGSKAVGASIQVISYNSSGKEVTKLSSKYVKNTGDGWTKVEVRVPDTSMSYDYKLFLRVGDNSGDTLGTAYFDDITVRLVSPLDAGTYEDMRIVSMLIVIASIIVLYIAYKYARGYEIHGGASAFELPAGGKLNLQTAVIVMFTVALFVRILLSVTYYQCDIDVNLFKHWGNNALSGGLSETYNTLGSNIDYPPLYVFFLYGAALMNQIFGGLFGFGQEYFFTVLIKLPSILSDIAIGYVIYRYAKKRNASDGFCLLLPSLWLFNPLAILDSACWGQVDSLLTIIVVLSIIFLNKKDFFTAGIIFGLGVMLKPQMFFFLPVFGYMWLKDTVVFKNAMRALKNFGFAVGGALIGALVPNIPFLHMGFEKIEVLGKQINLPWIFSLFMGTADHYSYATVNCYNFWFLLGKNWVKDDTVVGGLSIFTWGMLAIVAVSLVTLYFSLKIKDSEYLPYLLAAFMYAAVPCFAQRMHERYFFPCVALLIIAAVLYNNKTLLITSVAISASGFLSVSDIMMGLLVGGNLKNEGDKTYGQYYWPSLDRYSGIIAFAMVAGVVAILAFLVLDSFKNKSIGGEILKSEIYSENCERDYVRVSDVAPPRAAGSRKANKQRGGKRR